MNTDFLGLVSWYMKAALQLREANIFVSLAKIGAVVGAEKFCCLEGQL
jgi:hypothetical protein